MIRINLLPVREARRKANLMQQAAIMGATVLVTLIGIGAFHWSMLHRVSAAQARLAAMNHEIDKYKPQIAQVEEFRARKAAILQKLDVIKRLDRARSGPVHVLDELATRAPDRLWLTKLAAKDGQITLTGLSLDNEIIATFLTSLNSSPYFQNVELGESKLAEKDGLRLNNFTIHAKLTDPETKNAGATPATAPTGGAAPAATPATAPATTPAAPAAAAERKS
jgi:type IV pilus assembly protein PilN